MGVLEKTTDSKYFYITNNLYVSKDTAITFIITGVLFYLFFIVGSLVSKGIDYMFRKFDEDEEDKITFVELFLEIAVAYWLYLVLDKYIHFITEPVYSTFGKKGTTDSVKNYLVIAFYFGIFYQLEKMTEKKDYLYKKYFHV